MRTMKIESVLNKICARSNDARTIDFKNATKSGKEECNLSESLNKNLTGFLVRIEPETKTLSSTGKCVNDND